MANFTRRQLLLGTAGVITAYAGASAVCSSALTYPEQVSVPDFRLAGDLDDTGAFNRAIATGRPVYVPAGRGSGRNGVYMIGDVMPAAGTVIFGDGIDRTIIRPVSPGPRARQAAFFCDSGSADGRISEVRFSDMSLHGWVTEEGFSEHQHLMDFHGVEDLRIERVEFVGFQGDGLHLGSSRMTDTERHNRNVVVRDCRFDGLDSNNRNAISVIDVDGILIEECHFASCTRHNMPGAIDFEPNAYTFPIIREVTIRDCRFDRIGGNVATIAMHIPATVRNVPTNIRILGNSFNDYQGHGAEIYVNVTGGIPIDGPDMAIEIIGNQGTRGNWLFWLYCAKGVRASGNRWQDYRYGLNLGYVEPANHVRDVTISDEFVRCATEHRAAVSVFNASYVALHGIRFIDCGDGSPEASLIDFDRGRSDHVSIENVAVNSRTGRARYAIRREPSHTWHPQTNAQRNNDLGGLISVSIAE